MFKTCMVEAKRGWKLHSHIWAKWGRLSYFQRHGHPPKHVLLSSCKNTIAVRHKRSTYNNRGRLVCRLWSQRKNKECKMFDKMAHQDLVLWSAMTAGYFQNGHSKWKHAPFYYKWSSSFQLWDTEHLLLLIREILQDSSFHSRAHPHKIMTQVLKGLQEPDVWKKVLVAFLDKNT